MSKNTLQALAAAGKAAAAVAHTNAVDKLSSVPGKKSGVTAKAKPAEATERERLNLYLTGSDATILRELRKMVVNATGDAASGNALILTALRALDLKQSARLLELYSQVKADDARRK
jgi:hypothetical protein